MMPVRSADKEPHVANFVNILFIFGELASSIVFTKHRRSLKVNYHYTKLRNDFRFHQITQQYFLNRLEKSHSSLAKL